MNGPTNEICSTEYTLSFTVHSNLTQCKEKCDDDQNCNFFSISEDSGPRGVVCKTYQTCLTLKPAARQQTIYENLGL